MKQKNDNRYIVMDKEKIKTGFIIFFMLGLFSLITIFLIKNYEYDSQAIPNENGTTVEENTFYDVDLRLYVDYPNDWVLAQTYGDANENIIKKSVEENEDTVFSIFTTPLVEEVVSVLVISKPFQSSDGEESSSQFMSLNFHKDFEDMIPESKGDILARQLKQSVLSEETNIEEYFTQDINIIDEKNYVIKGKGSVQGKPIYFYQYSMDLGENMVNGIIGSRAEDDELLEKVASFVNSIQAK